MLKRSSITSLPRWSHLQRWNTMSTPFIARMCKIGASAGSASSVSGSARSWPSPGQVDGSTATGSHGPASSDDNRNTRRKLDTFSNTDEENARSSLLLHFPCEQFHAGVSIWLNNSLQRLTFSTANMHIKIHARQVPNLPGLYLRQELYVKTL